MGGTSIHASAVLVGDHAVLIRGPSGSGKSRLAFDLLLAGRAGQIGPATLVADDRVRLQLHAGKLMASPVAALAGLIEVRGLGVRRCSFVADVPVGLIVDLNAADAERLPSPETLQTRVYGILIPRIPVKQGFSGLPLVIAALTMTANSSSEAHSSDCSKEFGNHISPTIATK
jgi:HPr kinase/phosphorylase